MSGAARALRRRPRLRRAGPAREQPCGAFFRPRADPAVAEGTVDREAVRLHRNYQCVGLLLLRCHRGIVNHRKTHRSR